jgi:membrane fusion protein, macrolide-specific efflux system
MKVRPGTQTYAGSNGARAGVEAEQPVGYARTARSRRTGWHRFPVRQRAGGLLLAAACAIGAGWYVPRIVGADQHMLTGTVVSTGILDLNFTDQGDIAAILVRPGERISKGQQLATEDAPAAVAIVRADRAAVVAQRAELKALRHSGTPGAPAAIAAARAQLARDKATLASDEAAQAGAVVTAPAAGIILAVNGKPGETASADGVHDYLAQTQPTPVTQQPLFSLLPQGPESGSAGADSAGQLPLIELRTSSAWEVVVLVPGTSASSLRPGQVVTVSVPAAHLQGLRGRVQRLPGAGPVSTASGVDYEMVVTILSRRSDPPLAGMTADVLISS